MRTPHKLLAGAAMLAAPVVGFSMPAHAALELTYTVNGASTTCVDNSACDSNPAVGIVQVVDQNVGGVNLTGTVGQSQRGVMNLLSSASTSIQNTTSSAVTVSFAVGDTDFTPPVTQLTLSTSGTFTGASPSSVTESWYADTTNSQGGGSTSSAPGTQVYTYSTTYNGSGTGSFSLGPSGQNVPFTANSLFGQTELFTVSLGANDILTSRGQTSISFPVPEPTTLALLGSGLFGLGMINRRRKRS